MNKLKIDKLVKLSAEEILPSWKKRKDDVLPEVERDSFDRQYDEFINELGWRMEDFGQRS